MKRAFALVALAPLLLAAAAEKPEDEAWHRVKSGETLAGIAERAVVPRVLIIEANGLKVPFKLRTGQVLIIPRRRMRIVAPGETGFGIAYDEGVSWKDIATASGLDPKAPLKAGAKLIIPTVSAPNAAAAKPAPADETADADLPDHPRFAWPAAGEIRRGFTPPASRGAHSAIDIAGDEGDPVRATAKGRVVFAGEEPKKFGQLVVIDHGDGWFSAYAKLQKVTVKKGARVRAGERVGLIGNTGSTSNTELHFELRHNNVPVDPEMVLPQRD
ncbi:MAG: M23 family metallopeptidase [Novosphingobium sp.]